MTVWSQRTWIQAIRKKQHCSSLIKIPTFLATFLFPTVHERSSTGPLSGERAVNLRLHGPAAHQRLMRKTKETLSFPQPAVFMPQLPVCRSERCSGPVSLTSADGPRSRCAVGIFKYFVSKGYTLVEAAPLLFVVTSGRASR